MHKLYIAFLSVILAILVGFALISAVDTNPTVSMVENRALSSAPEFTVKTLLNGSYMQEFETFYTDTFPFRENLLGLNKALNGFYHYSGGGEEEILIIQGSAGAAQGGESLATVEAALSGTVETPAPVTATSQDESVEIEVSTNGDDDLNPVQEPSEASVEAGAEESAPAPEEMPYLESPEENLAETLGNVLLVGDRAMDIPNATESVMDNYIAAVNGLATAMGEDVRTISLVTPNSGEFYSPDSFHTGSHSQSALIDYVYAGLDEDIVTVDAYSALRAQTDEYIYFRTDHHWTTVGAYYAYR
ncbi:MAG: DHHW family protein, partial [Eubacteriales bacterium]